MSEQPLIPPSAPVERPGDQLYRRLPERPGTKGKPAALPLDQVTVSDAAKRLAEGDRRRREQFGATDDQ
ncbi:MAG: hypothetical protein AAB817_00065 [Patescibacteria group bacterium]